jgi:hypothetical protein
MTKEIEKKIKKIYQFLEKNKKDKKIYYKLKEELKKVLLKKYKEGYICEEFFKHYYQKIKELEKNEVIKERKKDREKGIKYCQKCGWPNEIGDIFCRNCGLDFRKEPGEIIEPKTSKTTSKKQLILAVGVVVIICVFGITRGPLLVEKAFTLIEDISSTARQTTLPPTTAAKTPPVTPPIPSDYYTYECVIPSDVSMYDWMTWEWEHSYKADSWDCSQMSAAAECILENCGYNAIIARGNEHAWLLVEFSEGWLAYEATGCFWVYGDEDSLYPKVNYYNPEKTYNDIYEIWEREYKSYGINGRDNFLKEWGWWTNKE